MANEMAARMREDGALDDAVESGTGATTPPPSAETLTTDTGGEPGPVPYSRFKEVNDQLSELRPYDSLRQYGYDADSLSRLAAFEAAFTEDPHGTTAKLVDNLDLPDEAKTQIKGMLDSQSDEPTTGGGTPDTPDAPSTEPPSWAKPLVEDYQTRQQQEVSAREEAARNQMLDQVISHWDEMDKSDSEALGRSVAIPDTIRLSLIATHASSNRYQDPVSLAKGARADAVAYRESILGSSVVPPGSRTGPRSVPNSAATPSPAQKFGGDIKSASKAALAAIERGEL